MNGYASNTDELAANAALFTQGFIGRHWDDLQNAPCDVALVIFTELAEAAVKAASNKTGLAQWLIDDGAHWMPTIEFTP